MSGHDFEVAPVSWDKIHGMTEAIRRQLGLVDEPVFPIMHVIEKILDQSMSLVRFEVGSHKDMGAAEGFTCPRGEFIQLREDVYELAWAGDGRARFTAAHEFGHLWLHSDMPLTRIVDKKSVPAFRRCEPQANQFAAEILMPRRFISENDTEDAVMQRHKVSWAAASNRLDFLERKGFPK